MLLKGVVDDIRRTTFVNAEGTTGFVKDRSVGADRLSEESALEWN